jgi:hypothetical protein
MQYPSHKTLCKIGVSLGSKINNNNNNGNLREDGIGVIGSVLNGTSGFADVTASGSCMKIGK